MTIAIKMQKIQWITGSTCISSLRVINHDLIKIWHHQIHCIGPDFPVIVIIIFCFPRTYLFQSDWDRLMRFCWIYHQNTSIPLILLNIWVQENTVFEQIPSWPSNIIKNDLTIDILIPQSVWMHTNSSYCPTSWISAQKISYNT